jgi:phenylpropionate dioxygenase-like ring-hydroxylating dioxygenase large terminal subunit
MNLRRLVKNEFFALLSQGETHESLFEKEAHGQVPPLPLPEEAHRHLEHWQMPEMGFRNYWYPVVLARDLKRGPIRRRLLGEDIVFWRDGGKVHALADRCPHRGASLSRGHIRFPGSGTISCPYHGWTFDGTGRLRACIQEGPLSAMPSQVTAKAYPVAERAGVVWVWIGDMAPVALEEDLPVAMKAPGVVNMVHFTRVWNINWAPLFDNFIDGLHAPYLHRLAPQYFFRSLAFRVPDGRPHYEFVEHDRRILELVQKAQRPDSKAGLVFDMDFPGLGRFPRTRWWRFRGPKMKPKENFIPGFPPGAFLLGLPCYVHTVHKDLYFTMFIVPIDRYHLYSMCALTGRLHGVDKLLWRYYYKLFSLNHDRIFIGQDYRVLRYSTFGEEYLSPLDQDIVRWRRFATRNARGYRDGTPTAVKPASIAAEDERQNPRREPASSAGALGA